ncbi:MAG: RNA polymerase sigma factor [Acidobacteria bacterium]|nr:RNA polymerase sigma factor [Acidobacteriota bacterium]
MNRTDEKLVIACREGDESAWEAITYKYQNLLYSIPRRAGLGKDLAADVLQEVFTTLFVKIDLLEKPEFLRAWLITTTKHKTLHLISREMRGHPRSIDDDENDSAFEIADKSPLADEVLVRLERESQIENAFTKIDDRCRRLLMMLYIDSEKLPYSEIVDRLNIPLGSIGPTRARCLEKLLKLIPK